MNSKDQSALLERMAGKHRATILAAALSDFERLDEAYQTALKSDNSALEEFEKRTTSIEYALGQLNATWQEFSMNTIPKEWIVNVINFGQSALEATQGVGALKVALYALGTMASLFANIKIAPMLKTWATEEKKNEAKTKGLTAAIRSLNDEIEMNGSVTTVAKNKFEGFSEGSKKTLLGLGNAINVIGKTLLKNLGVVAVVAGAFTVVLKLAEAFNNTKHAVSNLQGEIEELNTSISGLKTEQEELNSKAVLTTAEKQRLDYLEKQIALEERSLELKKEQQAREFIQSSNKYFDGDTSGVNTEFQDYMDEADKTLEKYQNNENAINSWRETINRTTSDIEEMSEEHVLYGVKLHDLDAAYDELSEKEIERGNIQEDLKGALSNLYDQQANYENALEYCTEAEKQNLLVEKAQVDAKVREIEVILGLASTYEDLEAEVAAVTPKVEALDNALNKISQTQSLTYEEVDELKKHYPELADKIVASCKKTEEGFIVEGEALAALQETYGETKSAQLKAQIEMTQITLDNARDRMAMYEAEASALASIYKTMLGLSGTMSEQKWADTGMGQSVATTYQNMSDEEKAKFNQYQKDALEYKRALEMIADLQDELNNIDLGSGISGDPGNGDIPSSGDKDSKKADVWDKYAHALAKANDEIERYNRVCEITQAKLDRNQSFEERNIELMSQEIQLYDELIANTQAKYKIVNDTLWAQQQGLQQLYTEASKHMGISAEEVAGLTDAELEAFIELKLDEDKANDQKIAHLLNGIVDMRQNVHDLHIDWLALKSDILELKNEQINVRVNFQNDIAEKFDEARVNSESLLDILEEMEGTEGQRLSIIESLINSYDTELNSTMQMYKSTGEELANMLKDGLIDTDQYNNLLKEANRLEEHGLEVIKEQHDMRLKQLEVEKQRAIANAEASIYGKEGQDAWEKSRQREIDRLQNQLEALEEDTSEADYLEQLSEKEEHIAELEEKLANLRNQKTIQQLKQQEDGSFQWEYVEDQRAINETMEELEDARNDLQKTKDDKALQEQKDAIQDRIDSIEDEIDSKQEQYDLELEQINAHYEAQKAAQEQFTQEQIDLWLKHVTDVRQALDTLETQTRKGLDEVTSETAKGMSDLQDAYNESFINITSDLSGFVDAAIREFNRLEAARRAAAEEARAMTEGAVGGSTSSPPKAAGGIKFVEANNFLARLHYGERVLTRQEASQYNELEDDIKSGKLQSYFDSLQEDTALSISNVAATSVAKSATVPTVGSAVTSFVIEHLELPQVKDPTDFAAVINEWARGEFGGLAQKARIIPAR